MEFREIEYRLLLEYPVGSRLYGTHTETSDHDFSGVFIAPAEYYFGLHNVKEADFSIVDKETSGKNSKDAVDRKFYELRNFMRLAAACNPSILEHLFVPADQLILDTFYGNMLRKNYALFVHKGAYHRFLGYAYSQKKKMLVKLENKEQFEIIRTILLKANPKDTINHLKDDLKQFFKGEHIEVGDIKIPTGCLVKKALQVVEKRFANMTHRTKLVNEFGYDTKFASHLIRLTKEGIELLDTGKIVFPLVYADQILDIKKGKYELGQLLEIFDNLEVVIQKSFESTLLPKYADMKEIDKLCQTITRANL